MRAHLARSLCPQHLDCRPLRRPSQGHPPGHSAGPEADAKDAANGLPSGLSPHRAAGAHVLSHGPTSTSQDRGGAGTVGGRRGKRRGPYAEEEQQRARHVQHREGRPSAASPRTAGHPGLPAITTSSLLPDSFPAGLPGCSPEPGKGEDGWPLSGAWGTRGQGHSDHQACMATCKESIALGRRVLGWRPGGVSLGFCFVGLSFPTTLLARLATVCFLNCKELGRARGSHGQALPAAGLHTCKDGEVTTSLTVFLGVTQPCLPVKPPQWARHPPPQPQASFSGGIRKVATQQAHWTPCTSAPHLANRTKPFTLALDPSRMTGGPWAPPD